MLSWVVDYGHLDGLIHPFISQLTCGFVDKERARKLGFFLSFIIRGEILLGRQSKIRRLMVLDPIGFVLGLRSLFRAMGFPPRVGDVL